MMAGAPPRNWKMCKHCDVTKPHQIREVKSKGKVAVQVGSGFVAERVKVYQATVGGTFERDDWLCSKFQAKLMNCYRKNVRSVVEDSVVENLENLDPLPNEIGTRSKQLVSLDSLMDPPPRKYIKRTGVEVLEIASGSGTGVQALSESLNGESQGGVHESIEYEIQREAEISVDSEGFSATSSEPPLQAQAVYSGSELDSLDPFSQSCFQVPKSSNKVQLANGLISVPFSESACVICGLSSTEGRKSVPGPAKKDLWMDNGIYLPKGVRCCMKHISEEIFDDEAKKRLNEKKREGLKISRAEISEWIKWLTDLAKNKTRTVNFDDPKTDEEAYEELLGLKKNEFDEVFEYIKDGLLKSRNRSPRNALAIFLAKLRLGVSQRVLARLFGIDNQSVISLTFHRVAELLTEKFVPSNLGFKHMSREQIMEKHNPAFVRHMFELEDGKLVFILDGTYFFMQASGDFVLQGKMYSSHKHRHLVKFMMVVTPDGQVACYIHFITIIYLVFIYYKVSLNVYGVF